MSWLFVLVLLVMSAGVALWLFRPPPESRMNDDAIARESMIELFRSELEELDVEHQRGLLTDSQYAGLKREIEKRLLRAHRRGELEAVDTADSDATGTSPLPMAPRWFRIGLAVAVPLAAGGLYLDMGRPDLLVTEAVEQTVSTDPIFEDERIREAVRQLEERVAAEPGNRELLLRLGQARLLQGRYRDAYDVYQQAGRNAPDDFDVRLGLLEARVGAARGFMGPEDEQVFNELRGEQPENHRLAYFLGVLRYQQGASEEALRIWSGLYSVLPDRTIWNSQLLGAIRQTAQLLGVDTEAHFATLQEQRAAYQQQNSLLGSEAARQIMRLPAEDQQEVIRSMVQRLEDRLEAEPDDLEGWMRLAQVYSVLENPEGMARAFDEALRLDPANTDIIRRYAQSTLGPVDPETGLPDIGPKSLQLYLRLAELVPTDSEANWYLGIFAYNLGQLEDAERHWSTSLAAIPETHPDHARFKSQMNEWLSKE